MLIALGLVFFSSFTFASEQQLNEAVLNKNLAVQSFDQAKKGEEAKLGALKRSFYPTLSLELGQENFETGDYSSRSDSYGMLEARFNLFRGGKDRIESSVRELYARISQHHRDQAVREEINKTRKLQYQIMFNNELISILEKELVVNKRLNGQALKRASSGVATKSDTLEFGIHELELTEEIEALAHENKILMIGLAPLMGLTENESPTLPKNLEHQHDDELLKRSVTMNNHPEVAALDAEYEGIQKQQLSTSRWWTPSVDLYGGYYLYTLRDRDFLAQRNRDDQVVGLRLTMELFDGRKSSTQATAASYQAESKRMMARYTEKQTEAKFLMLQEDLKHTHEVMHYVLERIEKSKEYLNLTLKEYDRGVKNSLDALTAMQRYYRYEKQYLEKKKEYQVIKADLLAILGE